MGMFLFGAFCFVVCAAAPPSDRSESSRPTIDRGQAADGLQGGVCGVGGSCCASGGVGCNDFVCCATVCKIDDYCCTTAWDDLCVGLANAKCGDLCSGEGSCPTSGDCCDIHGGAGCEDETCCDLVCSARPSCCSAVWDIRCVILAGKLCDQCKPIAFCPRPGNCCADHAPEGGCDRVACCELICEEIDDYCCITEWDTVCANRANQFCPNVCDCPLFGDFDGNTVIDLMDFAALQLCFSGGAGAYVGTGCECSDYDGDDDADLADFAHYGD